MLWVLRSNSNLHEDSLYVDKNKLDQLYLGPLNLELDEMQEQGESLSGGFFRGRLGVRWLNNCWRLS